MLAMLQKPIAAERLADDVFYEKIDEETELLARLIDAECGDDWCEDLMLYYTGSVVLNRVESELFPDTLHDVIYQPGQYSVVDSGRIDKPPRERPLRIAKELMKDGSQLPSKVVFQANFIQGEVYAHIQTMYFCERD